MKLSIIVPVYNTAGTLRRCVDSILAQEPGGFDYEVLLIDDGSTDEECVRLVDELASLSLRFAAFHKLNGGLSSARNYGLDRMSGDSSFVTFIDSDDELDSCTLRDIHRVIASDNGCDIYEYPVLQNPGCSDERLFKPSGLSYDDPMEWLAGQGLEHCWAWNKIYRRSMFDKVRFPDDRRTYEDIYTLAQLLLLRPRVRTISSGLYLYHKNENGLSQKRSDGFTPLLDAQISLVKTLGIDTQEPRWHRLYLNMFTSQLYAYRETGRLTLWPQRIAVRRYGKYNRGILKSLMLGIFGLRLSCKIFKIFSKR